uniref:Uncharacterized protein n=1 Tax=Timema cristinae TaxID=61476 RepID=A0A7R9CY70_TIMCR|nr:unnamed protein product [Timema cristinae]
MIDIVFQKHKYLKCGDHEEGLNRRQTALQEPLFSVRGVMRRRDPSIFRMQEMVKGNWMDLGSSWKVSDSKRSPYKASWWAQMRAVLWRSCLANMKEPVLIKVRVLQTVVSYTPVENLFLLPSSHYIFSAGPFCLNHATVTVLQQKKNYKLNLMGVQSPSALRNINIGAHVLRHPLPTTQS